MCYHIHGPLKPSFRGYQGGRPGRARYIFVGKDANFPPAFNVAHAIWPFLTAYLAGQQDWLFAGQQHADHQHHIHHPARLKVWPVGEHGWGYHNLVFAPLFRCVADGGYPDIHRKCSFVELLCWPTSGNTGGAGFQQLFAGHPVNPPVPPALDGEFALAQGRHRKNLTRWLMAPQIVFFPFTAFQVFCADGHVARPIAGLGPEANGYFEEHPHPAEDWWIFDSLGPHPQMTPRIIVTKCFPYFPGGAGQPLHFMALAIQRICRIIVENEEHAN